MSQVGKLLYDLLSSKEVFAALLGAFIGGLTTYWATSYQERGKQRKFELSLTSLTMMELFANLASAEYALDRVLPLWLKRKRDGYEHGFSLDYSLENTSTLSSKIYDEYFKTLAATELGVLLIPHYKRQEGYNWYARKQPSTIPGASLRDYVSSLALIIEGGIDLVDRFNKMKGMRRLIAAHHRADLEHFESQRRRRKLMAALVRTDETAVWELINGNAVRKPIPVEVSEAPAAQLAVWVSA